VRTLSLTRSAAALLFFAVSLPSAHAQDAARETKSAVPALENRSPLVGVSWYPEQWPESRWEADVALMKQANVGVVRLGEFAWSRIEPSEGNYDFAWLDRAIALAEKYGIPVVLGTPTAAPPAWMSSKYPDILRVEEDGTRAEHGNRQHFSFSSPRYRQFARKIAARLSERYGKHPNVVGWQIDNELMIPSFDEATKANWHAWLANRYGTVEILNAKWGTAYWSQTYNDFSQVPLRTKNGNPSLLLDVQRFFSSTWKSYLSDQVQEIRARRRADQPITTNTMNWFPGFDHYRLHEILDFASSDDYEAAGRYDWVDNAARHDLTRGFKERNFWVMEAQPGSVNWWVLNRSLDPGQLRERAWQAVGHGADAILYWQWRSSLGGQEQYHGAIVGADGKPNPIYAQVALTGAEFERAAPYIGGTAPAARVAMLQDYDSRWAISFQKHHQDFDPITQFNAFYRPLQIKAQAVDILAASAVLQSYKLVVAPALNVMTERQAADLSAYVRGGGHLVLGPRSGMKDETNLLQPARQPGPLHDLLGAVVAQYYALDAPAPMSGELGKGQATIWAETLDVSAPDARVVMRYDTTGSWLDGKPAIVTRRVGAGSITYVGAWLDAPLMAALAERLLKDADVRPIVPGTPDEVEIAERSGAGKRILIAINHAKEARTLLLPAPMKNILRTDPAKAKYLIEPHGVLVLVDPSHARD